MGNTHVGCMVIVVHARKRHYFGLFMFLVVLCALVVHACCRVLCFFSHHIKLGAQCMFGGKHHKDISKMGNTQGGHLIIVVHARKMHYCLLLMFVLVVCSSHQNMGRHECHAQVQKKKHSVQSVSGQQGFFHGNLNCQSNGANFGGTADILVMLRPFKNELTPHKAH